LEFRFALGKNRRRDAGATQSRIRPSMESFRADSFLSWNATKLPRGGAPKTRFAARQ
jgi:hypothetical protein